MAVLAADERGLREGLPARRPGEVPKLDVEVLGDVAAAHDAVEVRPATGPQRRDVQRDRRGGIDSLGDRDHLAWRGRVADREDLRWAGNEHRETPVGIGGDDVGAALPAWDRPAERDRSVRDRLLADRQMPEHLAGLPPPQMQIPSVGPGRSIPATANAAHVDPDLLAVPHPDALDRCPAPVSAHRPGQPQTRARWGRRRCLRATDGRERGNSGEQRRDGRCQGDDVGLAERALGHRETLGQGRASSSRGQSWASR